MKNDKYYYFTAKENGKKITESHGSESQGKNFTTCRTHRAEINAGIRKSSKKKKAEAETREAELAKTSRNNLSEVWTRYGSQKGRNGKRHDEQALYKSSVGHYKNYIAVTFGEDRDLTTVSYDEFEAFKDALLTKRSAQTAKHILRLFKKLCGMVGNTLTGEDNIAVQMPSVRKHTREDLTPEQLATLIAVLSQHPNRILCDMLLFIMATGIRRGEALNLTRKNCDFRKKLIFLEDRKSSGKDMDILIPMNRKAEAIMKRRIKENMKQSGGNDYIFPGKNGNKRFDAKRARSIMEAAGIPKTFRPCHGLRHWYACQLVDAGHQPHVVMRMLGHTDIATTMKYFEARESALLDAAGSIDQALEG